MPGRVGRGGRGKFYASAKPIEMTHFERQMMESELLALRSGIEQKEIVMVGGSVSAQEVAAAGIAVADAKLQTLGVKPL